MKTDHPESLSGLAYAVCHQNSSGDDRQLLGPAYESIPIQPSHTLPHPPHTSTEQGGHGYNQVVPPMIPTASDVVYAPPMPAPVSAYAKLENPNFVYYVQQLVIVIGHNLNLENPRLSRVDVDLYEYEGVAPKHCTIAYDFETQDFKLTAHAPVYMNGEMVTYNPQGIALKSTDILQVGGCQFYFLLPVATVPALTSVEQKNFSLHSILAHPSELGGSPNDRKLEGYDGQWLSDPDAIGKSTSQRITSSLGPSGSARGDHGGLNQSCEENMSPGQVQLSNKIEKPTAGSTPMGLATASRTVSGSSTIVATRSQSMPGLSTMQATQLRSASGSSTDPITSSRSVSRTSSSEVVGRGEEKLKNSFQKPPMSYMALIAEAICRSEEKKLTLNGIYHSIISMHPYYRVTQSGWRNSIRHNLSLNPCFSKVPRHKDQIGKGGYWVVSEEFEEMFRGGNFKRRQRKNSTSKSINVDTRGAREERSPSGQLVPDRAITDHRVGPASLIDATQAGTKESSASGVPAPISGTPKGD